MVDICFLCRRSIFDWRLYEYIGGNISMKDLTITECVVILLVMAVLVGVVGGHI